MKQLPKILVILGPTGSGKTDLGILLAKKFNGEIVNADSRQIYRGMDIGTGKPSFDQKSKTQITSDRMLFGFLVEEVPHYLFDIANPDETVTVAVWKDMTERVIGDILNRGKLPIVVGGTGLYIRALVENLKIPEVPPNLKLRAEFGKKSPKELLELLAKFDPDAAARLDPKNPRRIIRALEVSIWTGQPFSKQQLKGKPKYDALQIGIAVPREELYRRIDRRIEKQMKMGWPEEVTQLIKKYPRDTSAMTGLGYRELAMYPSDQNWKDQKLTLHYRSGRMHNVGLEEVVQKIKYRTHDYARRQLVWFRRDKSIHWIKTKLAAEKLIDQFLVK